MLLEAFWKFSRSIFQVMMMLEDSDEIDINYTVFSVSWNKLDVEHQSVEKQFDLEVDFGGTT